MVEEFQRPRLIILDFDGTFTDVEAEAGPFYEAYREDVVTILGPDFEDEWQRAQAVIAENPGLHGWLHDGRIVAPGDADPYLRATVIMNMIFDERGIYTDLDERTAVLQKLYFDNYPKADTVFRKEAKEVVEALLASDVPTVVVTNSATDDVQKKIDELDPRGRDRLRVIGNARKFIVTDPSAPDARFDAVPETIEIADLERPVYPRRGHYFDLLNSIWTETGTTPADTLVAGDIFELDLMLPAVLGSEVMLVTKPRTADFEKTACAALERGSVTDDLHAVLARLG
ncbi:MAG: HAD family hydrolase [Deltaproteobacteria bacterium]|nr:HAD family hydrolase [Deltaproteobacteria bacterium]